MQKNKRSVVITYKLHRLHSGDVRKHEDTDNLANLLIAKGEYEGNLINAHVVKWGFYDDFIEALVRSCGL